MDLRERLARFFGGRSEAERQVADVGRIIVDSVQSGAELFGEFEEVAGQSNIPAELFIAIRNYEDSLHQGSPSPALGRTLGSIKTAEHLLGVHSMNELDASVMLFYAEAVALTKKILELRTRGVRNTAVDQAFFLASNLFGLYTVGTNDFFKMRKGKLEEKKAHLEAMKEEIEINMLSEVYRSRIAHLARSRGV